MSTHVRLKVYVRQSWYVYLNMKMKITKSQVSNLIFIVFLLTLLFTPVGVTVKVWVNRLLSFSPPVVEVDKRESLDTYNWQLKDLNGKKYDFNSTKGKVVLVNLWATWCPPCIAEMPSLQALYNDYGNKVEFLFVTNENKEKVEAFFEKKGYDLPVYNELTKGPSILYSKTIPATYLIGKDGKIVISKTGAADWNSESLRNTIDQLLK